MANLAARIVLPRIFERGQDEVATLTLYRGAQVAHPTDGVAAPPSGSWYTLRNESGETIASGAVSVSVDGVASCAVDGALTADRDYSENWVEDWLLVVDGVEVRIQSDAMLVRRKLINVVTQRDLERLHAQLASEQLPTGVDDFSEPIEEAFEEFQRELINRKNRPNLIISAWSCRACVMALALSYIYRDAITNATGDTDRFEKLCAFYAKEYAKRFPALTYKVDAAEDGIIADKRESAQPVLYLSATPRASRRGLAE